MFGVAVALGAARAVWRPAESRGLPGSVAAGAALVGAVGFTAGFIGPLLVTPENTVGPLLGLVVTGPASVVMGAIGGGVMWMRRRPRTNVAGG